MSAEAKLTAEIEKWSKKLDAALKVVSPAGEKGAAMLRNIEAYRDDSKHFSGRGDLVKSFECLIWAWAILETGVDLGHLAKR